MYPGPRVKGYQKSDPVMRWALPERSFFACGACHILAYAFLQAHDFQEDLKAIWIKPSKGYSGNHIYVTNGDWVFDYHGYSDLDLYLQHSFDKARRMWPGWDASLIELPYDVLISNEKSRRYDGLWLREPKEFLYDALPRAKQYLRKFDIK